MAMIGKFTVGDLTIKPQLDAKIKEIHPAVGVVDNTAYVGVWIHPRSKGRTE